MIKRATIILISAIFYALLFSHASSLAATKITSDITKITVGARILAMGRASATLVDDSNAVFSNPAGIATINSWQISSMSGKLMEEISYVALSGAYPTKYGTFGFGYGSANIGGALPTVVSYDNNPAGEIVIDPSKSAMNYSNSVFVFSYGKKVLNNLSMGANLKLFSNKMDGGSISNGDASGNQLDLGILYNLNENINIGATLQNALPSNLGGKLTYASSGQEELFPGTLKVGSGLKLGDLSLLIDADIYTNRSNSPSTLHIGGEYKLDHFASFRSGIDQEIVGNSVVSNLTAGLGLEFNNIRFDYAYHQSVNNPGLDTHFFSISYGLFEKKPEFKKTAPSTHIEAPAPEAFEVSTPLDQCILF